MIKVNLFGYLVKVIVGVCDGIPTVDRFDNDAWFYLVNFSTSTVTNGRQKRSVPGL
ncbi:hypothetical protein [Mucilaginibacter sp. OK098]|uniref:hypothetical protein n=1 Tax=Mucilaginibacter sp. OK098 TaxID=1855297 RepID=UPI0009233D5E|nr:hypothetical protein [Mucilaginibacter sp. OK098]SHL89614.1 hypothetical protein SAMN05216524_10198 [Mucilaginibacter sp. OK098]